MDSLEERFWSKVRRCTHRHPCKRCCWPWWDADLTTNWKCVWKKHYVFYELGCLVPVHRRAYEYARGVLTFRVRSLHSCHRCDFGPCCNPSHLLLGSRTDNVKEVWRLRCPIYLPDGRCWTYEEACARQAAFYEAMHCRRVYAGEIPRQFTNMACRLDTPSPMI